MPRKDKGWAIGYLAKGNRAKHTAVLLAWNGSRWGRQRLPSGIDSAIAQSLYAGPGGELWIAGTQLASANRETRGFVAHREKGNWVMRYIDTPPGVRSSLQSVDATRDGAVVTGTIASTALVLRTCDLPSPDVASGRDRLIKITGIKARRKAEDVHAPLDEMPVISPAGSITQPAAPVEPTGLRDRGHGRRSRPRREHAHVQRARGRLRQQWLAGRLRLAPPGRSQAGAQQRWDVQ